VDRFIAVKDHAGQSTILKYRIPEASQRQRCSGTYETGATGSVDEECRPALSR
jgi:hypothetical protein